MSDEEKQRPEDELVYEDSPDLEAGDDPASDGAALTQKLAKLREKLSAAEAAKAENLAGWQRAKADLVNAGRRHEEERRMFGAAGEENVIVEVLPALDAFDMAMGNREAWEKVDAGWRKGVEYIQAQLLSALAKFGVSVIDPLGQKFDPQRHQPIATAKAADASQDDVVVAVAQKGYARGETVIRPASVTVAHLEA